MRRNLSPARVAPLNNELTSLASLLLAQQTLSCRNIFAGALGSRTLRWSTIESLPVRNEFEWTKLLNNSSEGIHVSRLPEHYGVLSPILYVLSPQLLRRPWTLPR